MILCLFPDCEYNSSLNDQKAPSGVETAKRQIIDHINNEHVEAHVIIACAHDMAHVEDFDAVTVLKSKNEFGKKGETIRQPQERLQCARCGQFEVRDRGD